MFHTFRADEAVDERLDDACLAARDEDFQAVVVGDHAFRDQLGRSAQRRDYQEFLVSPQIRRILEVLATHAAA